MTEVDWPWQYNFPPFFTLQPNAETRRKQMEVWCQLVLSYCRHHRIFSLSISTDKQRPLFNNSSIKRNLSEDSVRTVLDQLASNGHIEWKDKAKSSCLVMWRSASEWARMIYAWVSDTGQTGSVCTLFELTQGDDTATQPFHGLPDEVLMLALRSLESAGQAEIMAEDGGVKFF